MCNGLKSDVALHMIPHSGHYISPYSNKALDKFFTHHSAHWNTKLIVICPKA